VGGGRIKRGEERGRRLDFGGYNKSTKESATQCTSIDMNLI